MKLKLPSVEETDRINYRVPRSIKVELDQLAEQCKAAKLDFTAALVLGLRETAKAIRAELDKQGRRRGSKVGVNLAPETSTNAAGE
jgi:predicted TIM-barrel fold metal-dependent hydrolase